MKRDDRMRNILQVYLPGGLFAALASGFALAQLPVAYTNMNLRWKISASIVGLLILGIVFAVCIRLLYVTGKSILEDKQNKKFRAGQREQPSRGRDK